MARKQKPGWVEEIWGLAMVWQTGEKSIRQLFEPALPRLDNRTAFLAAVRKRLRTHPDPINAWQMYCWDKRTGRGPCFDLNSREVGSCDSSVKGTAGRYYDVSRHADAVEACADFIYREATWVLRGARTS